MTFACPTAPGFTLAAQELRRVARGGTFRSARYVSRALASRRAEDSDPLGAVLDIPLGVVAALLVEPGAVWREADIPARTAFLESVSGPDNVRTLDLAIPWLLEEHFRDRRELHVDFPLLFRHADPDDYRSIEEILNERDDLELGEWHDVIWSLADEDPLQLDAVLDLPLRVGLTAYERRAKDRALTGYRHDVAVWAMLAPHTKDRMTPPTEPALLRSV